MCLHLVEMLQISTQQADLFLHTENEYNNGKSERIKGFGLLRSGCACFIKHNYQPVKICQLPRAFKAYFNISYPSSK